MYSGPKQVKGVGTQIALTYVLTIEDPYRFPKSREVGCFLGLRPGRRNSEKSEPQKKISKEGDRYLRTMMVQGAHYILGPFGEDSDLRRWGLKLAERGVFPRRVQLPIALGLNLLLMAGEHVLSRDVADGAVQTHVVVMLDVTLHLATEAWTQDVVSLYKRENLWRES
jgi:transposase